MPSGRLHDGGDRCLLGLFERLLRVGHVEQDFAATLGPAVPHVIAGTLERAVAAAASDAEASGLKAPVVLLSPACASFDQYRNFEVRGDAFRALARQIPGVVPTR